MGYSLYVLFSALFISGVFSKELHLKRKNNNKNEYTGIHNHNGIYNFDLNDVIDITEIKEHRINHPNPFKPTYDDIYHYKRDRFPRHVEVEKQKTMKSVMKKIKHGKPKKQKALIDKIIKKLKRDFNINKKPIKRRNNNKKIKKHTKTTVKNMIKNKV